MLWSNLYYILQLENYLILVLGVGLLMIGASWLICRQFSFRKSVYSVYAYFYGQTTRGLLRLALELNRELLFLYLLLSHQQLQIYLIVLYGMLAVLGGILSLRFDQALLAVVNGGAMLGGLYICNMLMSYLINMRFAVDILIVWVMMMVFLVCYSLIFFMTAVGQIGTTRIRRKEQTKEN